MSYLIVKAGEPLWQNFKSSVGRNKIAVIFVIGSLAIRNFYIYIYFLPMK